MHRLHRDSHIAARARFRPLNETHYQLRKTNPIFFHSFIEPSKSANESRRNSLALPFPLSLPLFSLFSSFTPRVSFGKDVEAANNTRLKHLLSPGSAAFFLECAPPPSRYLSRDPQKTSTPRTHNLISFSRLVTATTPRAGILRRLACQPFVPLEKEGGKEAFNASYFPRNHPPRAITCYPIILPFRSRISPYFRPSISRNERKRIYISLAETDKKRKEKRHCGNRVSPPFPFQRLKISQSFVRV